MIEIDRLGRARFLESDAETSTISQQEIEDLLDGFGQICGFKALGRDFLPSWRARGRAFGIPANMLRDDWRAAIGLPPSDWETKLIVVRFDSDWWKRALTPVADAFGMTAMERALAGELAEYGDFDGAAEKLGISVTPSRNALTRLRRKFGVRNLPEVVSQALMLMSPPTGVAHDALDEVLAEMFELSQAQFAIVRTLAEGTSRKQAALSTNRSLSTVKAVLSKVFTDFNIENSAELASLLAQARLVGEWFLALDPDGAERRVGRVDRKFVTLGGRSVEYSLYGTGTGPVAVILHSTITCRHPPTRWVRRMIRHGWQVLALDRPGFGGSDSPAENNIEMHVATAASDLEAVARQEGFREVVLIARGSAQMAIALANLLGSFVSRAILVNPTPPIAHTPVDRGPLGAIKRRFARNPASVRVMIGLLLRLASPQRLRNSMRRAFAQSPPDLAALDDPLVVMDYLSAAMPLSENLDGYVVENVAWVRGWEPAPNHSGHNWSMLLGSHFVLHDPATAKAYFTKLLPQARVTNVSSAGQMLMYSHPEEVADAIDRDEPRLG